MRKLWLLGVLCFGLTVFAGGCAGPNPVEDTPDDQGRIAGFWRGVWHGMVAPVAFVVSLFKKEVHFYEVHNNGGWYNLGFVLSTGILFGGGAWGSSRKKSRSGS